MIPPSLNNIIRRRIEFIINEFKSNDGDCDAAIKIVARILSNYAVIGRAGNSDEVRRYNPRMSKEAKRLRGSMPYDEWKILVTNEHPIPISNLLRKWQRNHDTITVESVWSDLVHSGQITVTYVEDSKLRKIEARYVGRERYRMAGVEVDDWPDAPGQSASC